MSKINPQEPANSHDPWLENIKKSLDDSVDTLDLSTQMALQRARQKALSQPTKRLWPNTPILALAASLLLAIILLITMPFSVQEDPTSSMLSVLDDLPLLSAEDDFELYQSLEFLQWLESQGTDRG
jgi:hypothetical protein